MWVTKATPTLPKTYRCSQKGCSTGLSCLFASQSPWHQDCWLYLWTQGSIPIIWLENRLWQDFCGHTTAWLYWTSKPHYTEHDIRIQFTSFGKRYQAIFWKKRQCRWGVDNERDTDNLCDTRRHHWSVVCQELHDEIQTKIKSYRLNDGSL